MRCALLLLLVLGSSGGGSPEAEKLAAWRSRHQAAFPPAAPQPAVAHTSMDHMSPMKPVVGIVSLGAPALPHRSDSSS